MPARTCAPAFACQRANPCQSASGNGRQAGRHGAVSWGGHSHRLRADRTPRTQEMRRTWALRRVCECKPPCPGRYPARWEGHLPIIADYRSGTNVIATVVEINRQKSTPHNRPMSHTDRAGW